MEAKYIHPFIKATEELFTDFFNSIVQCGNPYWMEENPVHNWEISGIIGIAGESRGCICLSFPENTARNLTAKLLNTQLKVSNEDLTDSVGEAVNIIAGNAKKGLEQYRLMISLPLVVRGENHNLTCPGKKIPQLGIPLSTELGEAHLTVSLENILQK